MAYGIAANSADAREFLHQCKEYVSKWEARDNVVTFQHDDQATEILRAGAKPLGVYFNAEQAVSDGRYHVHFCLNCDKIIDLIPAAQNECESMEAHDFARCDACLDYEEPVCTGCGQRFLREELKFGDHADNYSGTTFHCERCWTICERN